MSDDWTADEMMTVASARQLADAVVPVPGVFNYWLQAGRVVLVTRRVCDRTG